MSNLPNLLFYGTRLYDFLWANAQKAVQYVDLVPEGQFVNSSSEELVEHVFSRYEIYPIELSEDQKVLDQEDVQVDVSGDPNRFFREHRGPFYVRGTRVTVTIPFSGDPELWKCQPNSYNLAPPRAVIRLPLTNKDVGYLDISYEYPMDSIGDGTRIRQEIDHTLQNIMWYLQQSRGEVSGHNDSLKSQIRQAIDNRRSRLSKQAEIAKTLNIPLRQKSGAPDATQLTIKKRIVVALPTRPNVPAEPEIGDLHYETILRVIRHEGRTFETTPATYAIHDEEGLRDIILAHLNGHFEGDAVGEVFRRSGKTDIRIEDKNRAAFVAECKVWRGAQELTQAIDQLLSYLTWRDCKAAIIIFNKTVGEFTGIQVKLPAIVAEHSKHNARLPIVEPGEWRYRFHSADDPARLITVHFFLFNLFVAKKAVKKDHSK